MSSLQWTTATLVVTITALWLLGAPAGAAELAAGETAGPGASAPAADDGKGETTPPESILRIFQIESADANELATVLQEFLRARETLVRPARPGPFVSTGASRTQIVADARTHKIVVETTSPQDLELLETLVRELDVAIPEVRLKTHVYGVKHSRADEVASVLQALLYPTLALRAVPSRDSTRSRTPVRSRTLPPPTVPTAMGRSQSVDSASTIVPYLPTNSLLIQAEPEEYEQILEILGEIDAQRRRVSLEAAIVNVVSDSGLNYAVGLLAGEVDAEEAHARYRKASDPKDAENVVPDAFFTTASEGDLPALVRLLKTHRDCQVLANPVVLADENERNSVDIVETLFIQNTTVRNGHATVSSQQGEDAGITLSMVPTIGAPQESILLDLDLQVSQFGRAAAGGSTLPPKIQTRVTSTVTVPDGQIFVIGGLARTAGADAESVNTGNLFVFLRARIIAARPKK